METGSALLGPGPRRSTSAGPPRRLNSLVVGLVLGVDSIGHCVALATLAFTGPLAFALGYGTTVILLSSAAITLIMAWRSQFPGALGLAEDVTIAVIAPAMVLAAGAVDGPDSARLATAMAIMAGSTLLSGLAMLAIGLLGWGRIARLIPYPVAAGFLAASGWLLVAAALEILIGAGTPVEAQRLLALPGGSTNLLLGLGLVLALLAGRRLIRGATSMIGPLLIAVLLFYVGLETAGMSTADARAAGLLPALSVGTVETLLVPWFLAPIDWSVVASLSVTIATIVLLNLMGFVLNTSGVEVALGGDVSIDAEARTSGTANIAVGAMGGLAGFIASDITVFAHRLGCSSRLLGLTMGVTTLVGSLFAAQIVSNVPVFAAAALLLYFGLGLMLDWLVTTWRRLPWLEWLVIPLIVLTTMLADITVAVAVGLVIALAIFVQAAARLPVARFISSVAERRSTLDRSDPELRALQQGGQSVQVIGLEGFLFFGSVETVIDCVRTRLAQAPSLRAVVLDMNAVSGFDSAACAALAKLGQIGAREGFRILLSAVPDGLGKTLREWDAGYGGETMIRQFATLDIALEAIEEVVLHQSASVGPPLPFVDRLRAEATRNDPRLMELLPLMERLSCDQGEVLVEQGTSATDVFFIERGRVRISMRDADGTSMRLRSMGPGAVVGEVALYSDGLRTADISAEVPSIILRLPGETIARINATDPGLASALHRFMAREIAKKLRHSNQLIVGLLD